MADKKHMNLVEFKALASNLEYNQYITKVRFTSPHPSSCETKLRHLKPFLPMFLLAVLSTIELAIICAGGWPKNIQCQAGFGCKLSAKWCLSPSPISKTDLLVLLQELEKLKEYYKNISDRGRSIAY